MRVEVGGVDLTDATFASSFQVEQRVGERSVARFTVNDPSDTLEFPKGTPLKIWYGEEATVDGDVLVDSTEVTVDSSDITVDDDGTFTTTAQTLIFAGVVETSTKRSNAPGQRVHTIRAKDWHYLADKRLVARSYLNQTANQIVLDLHSRYLAEEGVIVGNIDTAVNIPIAVFDYTPVSRALDELAELAGFWWEITPARVLHFRPREAVTAPWTVTPTDMSSDASFSREAPRYRNTQIITGVRDRTDVQVEAFRGDGEARTFSVGFDIAETPTVTVNGSPQSVGVRSVDEGRQWYWNKGDKTVSQDASETRLSTSDRLEVSYIGMFDAVILSRDEDAITDRATVETVGTGKVEVATALPDVEGRAAGFDIAARKLAELSKIGRRVTFTTDRFGLKPGQLATVDVDGPEQMLVTEVTVSQRELKDLWDVTAVSGPADLSWTKFFGQLAEQTRVLTFRTNISETDIVTRLFEFEKTWTESDGTGLSGDGPSPFRLVYPADALAVSDTLFPQIDPADRLKFVEITYGAGLKLRKQLTQTLGANTGEIVSTQYVGPNEANAAVVQLVEWFGGLGATAEVGSGVLVAAAMFGEPKTTAEAWSLVRTDTRDPAPDGWWLTGDVPEGVYG